MSDDWISQIVTKVAVQGATMVFSYLGRRALTKAKRSSPLDRFLADDPDVVDAVKKAAEAVSAADESGVVDQAALKAFLESPEVVGIVRQFYSTELVGRKEGVLSSIRDEFGLLLSLHLGVRRESLTVVCDSLFDSLLVACEKTLELDIGEGSLSAFDAREAARANLVLDELANISRILTVLEASNAPNISAILDFEKAYRRQVAARHAYIIPPHLDTTHKISITRLYVPTSFVEVDESGGQTKSLSSSELLGVLYRAVILGDPGGGKSTFVEKLAHDLATKYERALFGGRPVTPVLVRLREFGAEKTARPCSILEFIKRTSETKYQVLAPDDAFEYLLVNGRMVVIFDGLDELLDTSYRSEISGDVEAFCNLYPAVPVVVTSREVGYEQAPLDSTIFRTYCLGDFGPAEVEAYARKWFSITESHIERDERNRKTEAFVQETAAVPDLRSNPLMLALMCNIYRGEGYIPRNRPELYGKCATMLFERWDKSRGIKPALPFEYHLRQTIRYLAQWIYREVSLQSGVTHRDLVKKATEYLSGRRFETEEEAESAAEAFVEFCRGRAWVFTDTGTTESGERLYQFTHRTFLEYFTAEYLVKSLNGSDALITALIPKIKDREWDVVAQLAFQLQGEQEDATDILIDRLIEESRTANRNELWNLMYFSARALQYSVPSPRVIRTVSKGVIETYVDEVLGWDDRERSKRRVDNPGGEVLEELLAAGSETVAIVSDEILLRLREMIDDDDQLRARIACDLAINLPLILGFGPARRKLSKKWEIASNKLYGETSTRIRELAVTDVGLAVDVYHRGGLTIDELVDMHGLRSVLAGTSHRGIPRVERGPIGPYLLIRLTRATNDETKRDIVRRLQILGQRMIATPTPWLSISPRSDEGVGLNRWFSPDYSIEISDTLGGDGLFASLMMIALGMEPYRDRRMGLPLKKAKTGRAVARDVGVLLDARYKKVSPDRIEKALERLNFSKAQRVFVRNWVHGKMKLNGARDK